MRMHKWTWAYFGFHAGHECPPSRLPHHPPAVSPAGHIPLSATAIKRAPSSPRPLICHVNPPVRVADAPFRAIPSRTVTGTSVVSVKVCAAVAKNLGKAVFGVQNGGECYVGDDLLRAQILGPAACTMPCQGNTSETCGGGYSNNVYTLGTCGERTGGLRGTAGVWTAVEVCALGLQGRCTGSAQLAV